MEIGVLSRNIAISAPNAHFPLAFYPNIPACLNFRHRIDLAMIKGLEMSSAGLNVVRMVVVRMVGGEMQISLLGSDSGRQRVVRMVARHTGSGYRTLGTHAVLISLRLVTLKRLCNSV